MRLLGTPNQRGYKHVESPLLESRLPLWRSRLVMGLMMLAFGALFGRAAYLQLVNNDFLQEKGESRYRRDLEIPSMRGRITDRNGDVLAVSTPMKSIWAIPSDARLNPEELQQVARILEIDARELTRRLASDKGFVWLQRQVPPAEADKIAAMKLAGIHQDKEYRRYYPAGEMTAHLVGFAGVDGKGLEGVELSLQGALTGRNGSRSVIRDRRGQIVEDVGSIRPPQDGRDIRLAIDSRLQFIAYSQLKQAVQEHRAKAGGLVILDARTGEVLALANWPTYNPNNRENLSGAQLRNRALTDTFEPGSTLKPMTAALAIDKGKFRFDSVINTAPGRLTIGNATISDAHPHGALTVAQVIQKSSNVGAAKMAATLPAKDMWDMFTALGFGHPPQLGFPGEAGGRLRPWKQWRPIEQATMSYGHGISLSLMQLARAYTVFARDGELLPLSLLRLDDGPVSGVPVFSPQTARELRAMLELAAGPGGTAPKAQVPGYRVGGKTGTAHKIEGGVYANKYVSSFVGIAPMSDPRLVVAVMIDEPTAGKHYGGDVAAPVYAAVTGKSLRVLGVATDQALQVAQQAGKSAL